MGVLCLAVAGCSSDASDGSSSGTDCKLVPIAQVKTQFPNYSIDKVTVPDPDAPPADGEDAPAGGTDSCVFTGKPGAGAMGEYTDPTTVTLTVGTFDDDADGEAAFGEVSDAVGVETASETGYEVAAAEGKAVAKFDDGTYAFATIASPELDDPGTTETIDLIGLLAANR